MANIHLIGKQVFEMEVNTSENTYAIQQKISTILRNKLNPELEKLFNGFANQEEVWSIDYLEIDIGSINPEKLDDLVDKVLSSLESALQEKGNRQLPKNIDLKSYGKDGFNNKEKDRKEQLDFNKWKDKKSSASYSNTDKKQQGKHELLNQGTQALHTYYFKLWLNFLATGVLPSYAISPEKELISYVLEALVLDNMAVQQLEATLKKHPIALDRLVLQHRAKDLVSIVEIYTGFPQGNLISLLEDYATVVLKDKKTLKKITPRPLEIKLWKQLFQKVIIAREKLDAKAVVHALKKIPFEEEEELVVEEVSEESSQFFKNAGVVLLHPFLASFFKKLKLVQKGNFKNNVARSKAVLLLHYLTTGEEKVPEYDMFLPKFLCEMPSNMPLDHTLKISKKEKNEAFNLLKAAIENWGALGGTSPEGLQEGFLRREGKLEKEQSGWKLYVEQKTLDILLDKLPWNLSLIKLPWMKEILKVEWR